MKERLLDNFVKKWSSHQHVSSSCKKTITFDGNWKISRLKCACDDGVYPTEEFGDVLLGCVQTPLRKNYYCVKHAGRNLVFNNGTDKTGKSKYISMQPKLIKCIRLSNMFIK